MNKNFPYSRFQHKEEENSLHLAFLWILSRPVIKTSYQKLKISGKKSEEK